LAFFSSSDFFQPQLSIYLLAVPKATAKNAQSLLTSLIKLDPDIDVIAIKRKTPEKKIIGVAVRRSSRLAFLVDVQ